MTGIDSMLHPTFEALSAHADTAHDVASVSRVGRHVARCERCRAEVAEIRALGEAARAVEVGGAPADLWARIEKAATAPRPASASSVAIMATTADGPLPMARRHRALVAATLVIGAALAAVALWPRRASLQAAAPSRLTFTPSRPRPGSTVRIRYVPPAGRPVPARFVLAGRYARPAGQNPQGLLGPAVGELADSLGELVPTGDGAFGAAVRLPADFLAVSLSVHDPAAGRLDLDGAAPWMIVGSTESGGPSLASLLAAQDTRAGLFNLAARNQPRQAIDFADSLKRYFPQHPAGWAFTHSYGVTRGQFDFLRFYRGAERKYASMFDALWPQRTLDAERLHDMVVFAHNIDEPGEALRWAGRLAEEHPEDARAVHDLAIALHELELTGSSAIGDTIRHWLPALDRSYRRAPVPNAAYDEARGLVERYADSSTQALWINRGTEVGAGGNVWRLVLRKGSGGTGRDSTLAEMRRRTDRACSLAPGRLPLAASVGEWQTRCEFYRGLSYGYLSSLVLQAGQPREALSEADSAIAAARRADICAWPRGHTAHAIAALALGDTTTAESDLIMAAASQPAEAARVFDTAQARLGRRFDRSAATIRLDAARADIAACEAVARPRRQARMQGRPG